ncbi:MAG: carboxypeptidase regulatory-like domain-containing protein [Terracidiphilus sp.]|nr:carboxypeptidase regulatory-like domain-containing protein [Terracidiphilus sp.]MDR3798168.1 carboxypeptidase regulatory-like domain-containing protein [Terracidiphilus sp.]
MQVNPGSAQNLPGSVPLRGRIFRAGLCLTIALAALLTIGAPLRAQTASGTVTGVVSDPAGAVVLGANVTARNTATGEIRKTVSNSAGVFSIPALPPGPYTVDATAKGFEEDTSNLTLSVGQILNINFSLKVGSANEKIEVVATESTGLETEDHELNATMEAATMESLPEQSGYRNATFYAQTTQAGVEPGSTLGYSNINSNVSQYNQQSNQLFIAGQGFWSTSYLLDGVIDMSYFDQTATVNTPVDATQQVEIVRNSANARYDGANTLNAITKSGTQTIHGSVYEYLQNNQMNARGWAAGPLGELRYNLFGADAGWKIPFTKDKLFFFVSYEGFRQVQAAFLQAYVPTAAERSGDFSADLLSGAIPNQGPTAVFDPTSYTTNCPAGGCSGTSVLTQFTYNGHPNVINPALITPLATKYLNLLYPLPNGRNTNLTADNYGSFNSRTKFTHDDWLGRADYNLSEKDHLFGAYDTNNPDIIRPEDWDSGDDSPAGNPILDVKEHNQLYGTDIYLEESHVLSPTLVNTARVGYARSVNGQQFDQIANGTDYFHQVFGLTGLNPSPTVWGTPGLNVGGYSGVSGSPLGEHQNMFEYIDEVNLLRGKHSIFFGAEVDVVDYNAFWYTGSPNGGLSASGQYTYNGCNSTCPTGTTNTATAAWQNPSTFLVTGTPSETVNGTKFSGMPAANQLADFLLGDYNGLSATAGSQIGHFHQHNIMPYVQDDWRLSNKVTLNLGMRYDYYSPVTEAQGHAGILNPVTGTFSVQSYNSNRFNFSPRAGFAYALDSKTAIHGGGGIYYYQFSYYDLTNMMNNPYYNTGLNATQTATNPVVWTGTTANPNIPGSTKGQLEILKLANAESIWAAMPAPSGVFVPGNSTFAQKMPTSYSEQWNLAVQRTFGRDYLLTVDYVGSSNHHIFNYSNINQAALSSTGTGTTANINARRPYQSVQGNIEEYHKWGSSHYDGLEVQMKKSYTNGLQFNANYVWGKSMDFQDSDHKATGEMGNNPQIDYGRTDFMQKYVIKVSGAYELPIGKGKWLLNSGKWWENELGGWKFSGLLAIRAGMPFNATAGDNSNTGGGIQNRATATCNGNGGAPGFVPKAANALSPYFNTSCYTVPTTNVFGNERRNDLNGPRNTNLDLAAFKQFELWENLKFQWRTDAFDSLNHPLPGMPNQSCCSGTFGEITSKGNARTIQLSGKFLW